MCWECYNCVKICPQQAIDVRGYADFVPMGASVVPLRGSEDIMWTVKFRNGTVKGLSSPSGRRLKAPRFLMADLMKDNGDLTSPVPVQRAGFLEAGCLTHSKKVIP